MQKKQLGGLWLGVMLQLSGLGCLGSTWTAKGEAAVRKGEFRSAYRSYRKAKKYAPSDPAIVRSLNQLRPYAVSEAENEARLAIRKGQYAEALKLAAYVEKLDRPRAEAIRRFSERTMSAVLSESMRHGKMRAAYAFSSRCKKLFPEMTGLTERRLKLRKHFYKASQDLSAKGRFSQAKKLLSIVEHNEPQEKGEVARRRKAVGRAWADAIARSAAAHHERNELGAALALYARAAEVSTSESYRKVRYELAKRLGREGAFVLAIQATDDRDKREELALRKRLRRHPELRFPAAGQEGVTMLAELRIAAERCGQKVRRLERSHDYVAGHREVPNASYQQAQRDLDTVESDVVRLLPVLASQRNAWSRLQGEEQDCLRNRVSPVQKRLDNAESELQRLLDRRNKLRRSLRRTKRQRGSKGRSKAERERLRRLRAKILRAQQKLERLGSEKQAAQRVCLSKRRRKERAHAKLVSTEAKLGRLRRDVQRLSMRLASLSPTRSVPIVATFRYPAREVERTCRGELHLDLRSGWREDKSVALGASRRSRDEQHAAYPVHGILSDPLQFGRSDRQLLQLARTANVAAAASQIESWVLDYYQSMTRRALKLKNDEPHAASQMMVAMLLAAPHRLDGATKNKFGRHLTKHYRLARLASLRH